MLTVYTPGMHVYFLAMYINVHRYFMTHPSGTVVSIQQGAFRTNCIDCLDRTNVVQSMLAQNSLQDQLQVSKNAITMYTYMCVETCIVCNTHA